jgi:Zn ribbon nucleic-acid-binding protein
MSLMEKTFVVGTVKDCCKDAANLGLLADESRNGLTVKRCRACGCRHRRLVAEPGVFGMTFRPGPRQA